MFLDCEQLASLDLRHFDTSSAEDMSWMLHGCTRLKDIGVDPQVLAHGNTEEMFTDSGLMK